MDDKEQPVKIQQKYIDAVEAFLGNLRDSDFLTHAGELAYEELTQYKLDMALDIQRSLEV